MVRLWSKCRLVVSHNDPYKDIQRKLRVNPDWFLIGEIDGKIVASCMVGYEGHRGWINYLAVLPKFQRRGIASRMMGEAERVLRSQKCPKINLQIRTTNSEVIAFYRSLGYDVDQVINMGKRLETDTPHERE